MKSLITNLGDCTWLYKRRPHGSTFFRLALTPNILQLHNFCVDRRIYSYISLLFQLWFKSNSLKLLLSFFQLLLSLQFLLYLLLVRANRKFLFGMFYDHLPLIVSWCSVTPSSGLANSGDTDYSLVPRALQGTGKPAPKPAPKPTPTASGKPVSTTPRPTFNPRVPRSKTGVDPSSRPGYAGKSSTQQHPLQY